LLKFYNNLGSAIEFKSIRFSKKHMQYYYIFV
jgi:hypothetical protein